MNHQPYIKLDSIEEMEDDVYKVRNLLKEEWVYLGMRVTRKIDTHKGEFSDKITYILGKPSKEAPTE